MLIASCTSYPKRISNLPTVVGSVLRNTVSPDKVIINLSRDEFPNQKLPDDVQQFIESNKKVSVNWLEGNWKVYKKFLPVLKDHQNDLIFTFDDDILYPEGIIEDLMELHKKYPDMPCTTNNSYTYKGVMVHCGAGSLIQAKHFRGWEQYVNEQMIAQCPADDIFYTFLVASNGYFYKSTKNYIDSWVSYNPVDGYSVTNKNLNPVTYRGLYNVMGFNIKKYFSKEDRPVCLLNIYANPRGLGIEEEFMRWVKDYYNVIVVEHNGKKFEYTGLNILRNYVINSDIKVPVLYLQSKGAVHVRRDSEGVRRMWRGEFSRRRQLYFQAVSCEEPAVAAPYCGIIKADDLCDGTEEWIMPYYNGWVANPAAIKTMHCEESDNRYVYEARLFRDIKYIGIIKHDLHWSDCPGRIAMQKAIINY